MHLHYLVYGLCQTFIVVFFPENKMTVEIQKSTHLNFFIMGEPIMPYKG